jgi:hypothetical protein
MIAIRRSIIQRIAFAGVLTLLTLTAQAVVLPSAAEARCNGAGSRITSTLIIGGVTYVSETPVSGTCNSNGTYQATFRATQSGFRASVWIQNNGQWVGYFGQSYTTAAYSYSYRDANSRSLISLCIDNGVNTWCGWGSNYAVSSYPTFNVFYNGVNHGF